MRPVRGLVLGRPVLGSGRVEGGEAARAEKAEKAEKAARVYRRDEAGSRGWRTWTSSCGRRAQTKTGPRQPFCSRQGAGTEWRDEEDGTTAIMCAAIRGSLGTVTLLFNRGANIHARCNIGDNALMQASLNNYADIVSY